MAHGNIYPAEKIDAALTHYFRAGNLSALRELALLWLADKVDEGLQRYRADHGIHGTWEARERVVVALTGGPEGETLIRRAARIAARSSGGDLLAVHVTKSDGLTGADPAALAAQRRLAESWAAPTTRSSATTCPRPCSTSPGPRTRPSWSSASSRRGLAVRAADRPRRQHADHPRLRRHRRAHRDARADGPRPRAAAGRRGGLTRRRRLAGYALAVVLAPLLTRAWPASAASST